MQIVDKIFLILALISSTSFADSQMTSARKTTNGINFQFKDGSATTIGAAGCGLSDYVCSGTYTPTITSEDCTGTPTVANFKYTKIGNVVQVAGDITAQCANSQGTTLTLPVDPLVNFSAVGEANGIGSANSGTSGVIFNVISVASSKTVRMANRGASQGAADNINCLFTYKVK